MDFRNFSILQLNAYPAISLNCEKYEEKMKEMIKDGIEIYGVFHDDNLVGGMMLFYYKMNLLNEVISACGIGSIAVDLCRKKEKVAREIMKFYLNKLREKGIPFALLYPFNPEFYNNMGFSFGTLLNQFKLYPKDLPKKSDKNHIAKLDESHVPLLCNFYNSMFKKTNGLIEKDEGEFLRLFKKDTNKIFGCIKDGKLIAYIISEFRRGNLESFLVNDLFISEILFENSEGFYEIMAFLKSQSDQFRYIILNTQDEDFVYSLKDPRNHSEKILFSVYHECIHKGVGIMYRITDVKKIFSDLLNHNFQSENLKLCLNVTDNFIEDNNQKLILNFQNGKLSLDYDGPYDVELCIDICELSALLSCNIKITSLYKYGLIKLSDESSLYKLDKIFATSEKPQCLTYF